MTGVVQQPPIKLNADLSKRALMRAADAEWAPSPAPGVTRRLLDRDGGEVARATSIVRYAPGSRFAEHVHAGGEEFFVLEGVFADASGAYPAGTYVRNPPGTAHAPWTEQGCVIFVKLRQMRPDDRALLRIDTSAHSWIEAGDGSARMPLYEGPDEQVELRRWPAGGRDVIENPAGIEVLVLEGGLSDPEGAYETGDWLRAPAGEALNVTAVRACRVFLKRGHLG